MTEHHTLSPEETAQLLVLADKFIQNELNPDEANDLLRLLDTGKESGEIFGNLVLTDYVLTEKFKARKEKRSIENWNDYDDYLDHKRLNIQAVKFLKKCFWPNQRDKEESIVPTITLISVLVVLFLGLMFTTASFYSKTGQKESPLSIARIIEVVDAVWKENTPSYKRGQRIDEARLNLEKGLVQLEMNNGTKLILEGPADFRIRSSLRTQCDLGRLNCEVPPQAIGFEVGTPGVKIVDKGTVFSVIVHEQETEVVVSKGIVDLFSLSRDLLKSLFEKDTVRIDSKKKIVPVDFDPTRFLSSEKFLFRLREQIKKEEDQEILLQNQWKRDPDLIAFYDFNRNDKGRYFNLAGQGTASLRNGSIGEGIRRGSRSVCLNWKSSSININLPQNYQNLTILLRARIDQLNPSGNILFASNERFEKDGAFLWHLLPDGKIQLQIRGSDPETAFIYTSESITHQFVPETWSVYGLVVDSQKKTVSFYLDGKLLSRIPFDNPVPLWIGNGLVGNLINKKTTTKRVLDGAVDQLFLYRRALSDSELLEFKN